MSEQKLMSNPRGIPSSPFVVRNLMYKKVNEDLFLD